MTQDEIRALLINNANIYVQIASASDNVPEVALGDTFIYAVDANGERKKMPFLTIITKDYPGFDEESKLNLDGAFRVNVDLGKEKFEELFGFLPKDLSAKSAVFDFTERDSLFPHPVYGPHGWLSVTSPAERTDSQLLDLIEYAKSRALSRAAV